MPAEHDPDSADVSRDAIDAGLVRSIDPLNCETAISDLKGEGVTPTGQFYVRNHFAIPNVDGERYRLVINGLVNRPLELSLNELHDLPSQSRILTLECAGNGRSLFVPAVPGEAWRLGAVSTAEWTGVPLVEVLTRAGMQPQAAEIIFRGADSGRVANVDTPVRFERSLPAHQLRDMDALLAYSMNGEPLSPSHGYPLRLIVPGWYGVASVKWLSEITISDKAFDGYFQTKRYWYEWIRGGRDEREPVTQMNVRALVVAPGPGTDLPLGDTVIRGVAWSGAGGIAKVEVSLNGGSWQEARMIGQARNGAWQWWELPSSLEQVGPLVIRARATDVTGRTQPEQAEWNRLGYGNNSIHAVSAHVI